MEEEVKIVDFSRPSRNLVFHENGEEVGKLWVDDDNKTHFEGDLGRCLVSFMTAMAHR